MDRIAALRDSAVQIAAGHLNIVSSVKELCESSSGESDGAAAALATQLLAPQDESNSLAHFTMATEGVWRAVVDCWEGGLDGHLLSALQRESLTGVLQTARLLLDNLLFLPHVFLQHVVKHLPQVPLEAVCRLHSVNILSLEAFLEASQAAVPYLISGLVNVSCNEFDVEGQKTVMQIVAQTLCELVRSKSSVAVDIVQQLPAVLLAQTGPARYSFLRAAMECPSITSAAATELGSLLFSSCLEQPHCSLLEVVSRQSKWQYSVLPDPTTLLYLDIISALGSSRFIQLAQRAMSVEQLNWPALLQALVCFLHTSSSGDTVTDLVRELVIGGLEDDDSHLLSSALLIARQASLEGPHIFPSYQNWLQTTFGDSSSSVVAGKRQLLFLLNTLTSFVPHDPVFALKAHISQPPCQVAKCLTQLNDYISLASTRLHDLGEKVPTPDSEECDAGNEVAEAIAYYSQHSRISQPVMEASIFRSPYFVGRFLRSLLSPSPAIDGDREIFIRALAKEKKIPLRMLRNYEKACLELRQNVSTQNALPPPTSDGVVSVLRELPCAVMETRPMTRWLSHLSACLHEETTSHTPSTVQLVDEILGVVCESVTLLEGKSDASYTWVDDLLTVLSEHTYLHPSLYHRLNELLNTQLPELTGSQLLGLAVLLCHSFCMCLPMASVKDGCNSLSTGAHYCVSLLSGLRHDTSTSRTQSLRFSCLFIEYLMSCSCSKEHSVPDCLVHKMVYLYRRERFLQTCCSRHLHSLLLKVVQAVETLLQEHNIFANQWQSCKLDFQLWLSWELGVSKDGVRDSCRRSYRWNMVFRNYLQTSSAEELFSSTFETIAHSPRNICCTDFVAIMQELSYILLERKHMQSALLQALKSVLSTTCGRCVAEDSMMLAMSLPPHFLFTGYDIAVVAEFIQCTLAPLVQDNMMVLPPDITHYLLLGACTVSEEAICRLCDMSSIFLVSSVVHWPMLPSKTHYSIELRAIASWLHSGIQGPMPSPTGVCKLVVLGVALWHYLTGNDNASEVVPKQLMHIPTQAVVILTACCVHWLMLNHQAHPVQSTVDELLQSCLQREPSAVEVFCNSEEISVVSLQHSELLVTFRTTFPCKSCAFYPVLLLRLIGKLSVPMMHSLMAVPCFLRLCVSAYNHCLSLCAPLPSHPPLTYQPLSVEFIQDSNTALQVLVQHADCSQLQNVSDQLPSQFQLLVTSKFK